MVATGQRVTRHVGPAGAREAAAPSVVAIVVDALRASSTIITAMETGARSVRVVGVADACVGEVTAGERDGKKLPGLDHGNSPLELRQADLAGRELVLTTTNGARCVDALQGSGATVLIGTLLNATAVARVAQRLAQERNRSIALVLASRHGELERDDEIAGDAIQSAIETGRTGWTPEQEEAFLRSPAAQRLRRLDYDQDAVYCARVDATDLVPILDSGRFIPFRPSKHPSGANPNE